MTDLHAAIRERLQLEDDHESMSGKSFAQIGPEQAQAALLATLELHEPKYYDGIQYEEHDEAAYDGGGKFIGYVRVKGAALPPDWCEQCSDIAPCQAVRIIAEKLGIET